MTVGQHLIEILLRKVIFIVAGPGIQAFPFGIQQPLCTGR